MGELSKRSSKRDPWDAPLVGETWSGFQHITIHVPGSNARVLFGETLIEMWEPTYLAGLNLDISPFLAPVYAIANADACTQYESKESNRNLQFQLFKSNVVPV